MPFRSKAQARKFFAMESRGELPPGTARRWAHETRGGIRSLPERVRSVGWYSFGQDEPAAPAETVAPVAPVSPAEPVVVETFWQRHGGEIIVGVVTAVTSAVLTYYAMKAVTKK